MTTRLSRRAVMRVLGAAFALPALEMALGRAATTVTGLGTPRRAAWLYFPNGIARGVWKPRSFAADGRLLKLNAAMSSLEPFKDSLIIPTNLFTRKGMGHKNGTATWLTGNHYKNRGSAPGAISVDQLMARHLGKHTRIRSLELSLKRAGAPLAQPHYAISWNGGAVPTPREVRPRRVFNRLFGVPGKGSTSVVDSVHTKARSVRDAVSIADRWRLEDYFAAIRDVEKRIASSEAMSLQLLEDKALTDTLTTPEAGVPSSHREYVRLMLDLMVLAFQSNSTRIISFMLGHGRSDQSCNFVPGVRGTWHALSHYKNIDGDTRYDDGKNTWSSIASKRAMYVKVIRWHHEQLAYLLGRLAAVAEPGGGSLLDNSMILYGSAIGDGSKHDKYHLPTIIAGGGGGSIRSGRLLAFAERTDLSRIHTSMLQKMGVPVPKFGTADGPMVELDP